MIESDTDTRQATVGALRRLARHMRQWDRVVVDLYAINDPEAAEIAQYRAGLRQAVALAFLGTGRTDAVDEWIDDLLDTDDPSSRLPMPTTDELEM